jgi:glucose-6-phosphate 1-epimerase
MEKFKNGFEYIEINNKSAQAKIALQGAHLFHYEQKGKKPLLWLSETSLFSPGKAIRGGVPICWPWFGKHKSDSSLPQHGFARTSLWQLLTVDDIDEHTSRVKLRLRHSDASFKLWPFRFELILLITVGSTLSLALTTINRDDKPFEITAALHSYFRIADISDIYIEGLDKTTYFDSLTNEDKRQNGNIYIAEEVDRIYRNVLKPLIINDQERKIHITGTGSSSVVVWNPWKKKCTEMSDMKNDAYKTMLCLETANALADARIIMPGEQHELKADISCE